MCEPDRYSKVLCSNAFDLLETLSISPSGIGTSLCLPSSALSADNNSHRARQR